MIHVALVETVPSDSLGSMRRYADLIDQAFQGSAEFRISRHALAKRPQVKRWLPSRFGTLEHHACVYSRARKLGRSPSADLFHVVDGSHGYVVPLLQSRPTVVTVHDVIPALQVQGRFATTRPNSLAKVIIDRALRGVMKADAIVCVSESTRNDLQAIAGLGRNVSTLYSPLESLFALHNGQTNETDDKFILHLGNNAFYKNRIGVIRTYIAIADKIPHRLIMAGPAPQDEHRALVAQAGLEERVEFMIHPSDDDVRRLYRQAALLLFPSVYEGFGWPPLEAMASGCAVVCSDSGSLPEIVGDAALMAPHNDVQALASQCLQVLKSESVAKDLVQRGLKQAGLFTIERFRDELAAVYGKAVSS